MMSSSEELAKRIRIDAIKMVNGAKASHIASAFSCADIIAVLYEDVLRISADNMKDPNRDRLILSKGHSGVALYAVLAEKGFFPKEWLDDYGKNGNRLSCHVSSSVPGVELSTGSLGHGLGVGCGIAYSGRLKSQEFKVYVILGDGECNEGAVWEAALFASHNKLDNLIAIIDKNNMQAMGFCDDVVSMEPFAKKWEDFGFETYVVENGNDHAQLKHAFSSISNTDRPKVIIANTVKGKGVSFMENNLLWHYRDPQNELFEQAIKELQG